MPREVAIPAMSNTNGIMGEITNMELLNKKLGKEHKGLKVKLEEAQAEKKNLLAKKMEVQQKKDTLIDQIKRMKQRKGTIDKQIKIIEDMSDEKDKSVLPFEEQVKALQEETKKAIEKEKYKLDEVLRTLKDIYEVKFAETQTEQYAPVDQSLAEAVRRCHMVVKENQELTEKKREEARKQNPNFQANSVAEIKSLKPISS